MITNWQDPASGKIYSSHISGLQDAIGKIEDSIGLQTVVETGMSLSEVFIEDNDRYRIYQCAVGRRNWLASPAPVIKKNGVTITDGFTIDYGGGAIILDENAISTDFFTVDCTRTNSTNSITPSSIGAETPSGAQNKVDTHAVNIASSSDLGHIKVDNGFSTGLEFGDGGLLRLWNWPQVVYNEMEYTDDFPTVFNITKKFYPNTNTKSQKNAIILVQNRSDPSKFLYYHIFAKKGSTYGFVLGKNSNNDTLVLPYPGGGEFFGTVSSATTIGYGVCGSTRMGIQITGWDSTDNWFKMNFMGVEAVSNTLNVKVSVLLT